MPFDNEHSARQKEPGLFVRIRQLWPKKEAGEANYPYNADWVRAIGGPLKSDRAGGTVIQAIRFKADKWTPAEARKWLKEHEYKTGLEEATGEATSLALFAFQAPTAPWEAVAEIEDREGVRRQRFHKEIIKLGTYAKSDGEEFTVEPETLNHWVASISEMRMNGVRIPLLNSPDPHEGATNPRNSIGQVESAFVSGDGLVAVVEIVGDEAIAQALANDVSIYSPAEYSDAKGNVYARPILHVALTPAPVIQGLGDWQAIAASLKAAVKGDRSMKSLKAIAKALGVEAEASEDWTDENAGEKILEAVKALKASMKAEHDAAVKEIKEKAKAVKGSEEPAPKPEPDPVLLSLATENRSMQLSALVAAGKITPAVATKLSAQYVEPGALKLSIDAAGVARFSALVDALKENDPLVLAEKTGAQIREGAYILSRPGEDKAGDLLLKEAEKRAAAAKAQARN